MERAEIIAEGSDNLSDYESWHLYFADSFIRNAIPLMIHSTSDGTIYILNGKMRGNVYTDADLMIRDIDVEENSRRSAGDFFASRQNTTTILSINNNIVEVRGLLTANGHWQTMIMPAMTKTTDVRGLFHAFKNLLLNLQVLYVVSPAKTSPRLVRP